ncbi:MULTISPECIES: hypothetical protein [unclassified Sulfitobacter]|uniref:hypothetical protein n=1 Tax=unclassified Sulfitobacter TaxID=196795 RepID=UPI0023E114F9|nr:MULTISPECIES: hypothetical protein [unclassified Sulfitobacter]MDF3422064.1 hypothetical protein [Sulfitobacter sp. KE43]MDF3433129.1 hypothetical protein [Sulfitobacter sp. KE42]MDF3474212.1 hypothetical protein [Sulfitobacter sp. M48]MDF3489813.1 hypothetical protein [Sulfitobacter sp. M60]MDF3497620.1 hypothetical protein [Sulfitobacter sp. M56]MDF3517126.1 hypothetical protein [Sulfitobacter sp. M63]MDF3536637.1 hypothetical protein [Sulfitobacter sp. M71]
MRNSNLRAETDEIPAVRSRVVWSRPEISGVTRHHITLRIPHQLFNTTVSHVYPKNRDFIPVPPAMPEVARHEDN